MEVTKEEIQIVVHTVLEIMAQTAEEEFDEDCQRAMEEAEEFEALIKKIEELEEKVAELTSKVDKLTTRKTVTVKPLDKDILDSIFKQFIA